jgi:hypothetical protein
MLPDEKVTFYLQKGNTLTGCATTFLKFSTVTLEGCGYLEVVTAGKLSQYTFMSE